MCHRLRAAAVSLATRLTREGDERARKPSARAGLGPGGIQGAALATAWYLCVHFTFVSTLLTHQNLGESAALDPGQRAPLPTRGAR